MAKKKEGEFGKLTRTVERGFAATADEFSDIKKTMATKDDLAALERRMDEKFAAIIRRLDKIMQIQLDEHASRIKKLERAVFK
ncbi:hypothetical protein A2765_03825 [Candidatus Kaiserbacteria bacterium RIFCSPHIGHO2_01_FULL_56_24]|uniref:Uncharacterized protein n=1 Tax=Candidatus Kaiserbacteria bacterium RIFCSPHIGHO2_01_FULL_56_24 TaxID=1798487 RepID=A0A1F6DGU9_9BACT|nr:MAG: hypothetical protein A2765_03825 [Candidatus Kaiserbacteria bacterium RIFCSPHIGHO2_01_FULL_56_24]